MTMIAQYEIDEVVPGVWGWTCLTCVDEPGVPADQIGGVGFGTRGVAHDHAQGHVNYVHPERRIRIHRRTSGVEAS